MLLVRGENLGDALASTHYDGVKVVRSQASSNGHYLFAWIEIRKAAAAGDVIFDIKAPSGKSSFHWPLLARTSEQGRFQGISRDDVIYLIMPDRFADGDTSNDQPVQSPGTYDRSAARAYHGGDLRGVRDHLDYLKDLGVTTVWLNPVYDNDNHSASDYHGYGAVDFYAVDEHLGTLRDFQDLVAAAHARDMKLVLDVVVNHTGPHHPWVDDSPTPDWFHGTREHHSESSGTFGPLTDPHALPVQYRDLIDGWFANFLPDLKQENPLVTQYLIDNNLWWAESTGLDGFRLDTFPYVPRTFWSEWHKAIFEQYPNMNTVGEVFNPDPTITSFFVGGTARFDGVDSRLPAVFDFPTFSTLRDVLIHDAPVRKLVDVLQRDWLYAHPESLVTFLGNHDTARFFTSAGESREKLKNAFSLLLTVRGIPQLYSGDEIAMPGGDDPDNRRDFPGGFPGDPRNAFTAAGRTPAEQEVFAHLQGLLRLRKEHPALREGRQYHVEWDDTSYVFLRESGADRVLVIFNNGAGSRRFEIDLPASRLDGVRSGEALLGAPPATVQNTKLTAETQPHTVSIYSLH
jgi:glycosidase